MKNLRYIISIAFISLFLSGFIADNPPHIFLVGDSTMADKPPIGSPERGWGEPFRLFFKNGVVIENHARNGRSTKSFIAEERWNAVVDKLQPGDYVVIQFGHNDEKQQDTSRYAAPHTDYKTNLLRFIHDTKSKGAFPVLLTPVVRRKFDKNGKLVETHGEYPDVVREVGREADVPVIDVQAKSAGLLKTLGAVGSIPLFMHVPPKMFSRIPEGKNDDTHFTWQGASAIASLVVEGMKEHQLPLCQYLLPNPPKDFPGMHKLVLLDYYFNNERKKDKDGTSHRFHYVWEDTTDSGFSGLGEKFIDQGAEIDSLSAAPTTENLAHASIYIIVDPDTPTESEHPNYIDTHVADVIAQWVNNGGVLVIMSNDTLNSDFDHLNILSERFGIHFNGDSKHSFLDTKKDYLKGWSTNLPNHPLFEGINGLFMKQVSSLSLTVPAQAILTEDGSVLMAEARIGKGLVFAVGDPWFYNEYMDHKRLPAGYENAPASERFAAWLCRNALTSQ